MSDFVTVGYRKIGHTAPVFVIAEAGVNHNGSFEIACQLVDVAKQSGADAIKFQTFRAERIVSVDAPKADYQLQTTEATESQITMLKRLELSFDVFRDLQRYCQKQEILFLSTPFDEESVDFLDGLEMPLFKIPSGELTNLPFLKYIAQKGKPMIISTGMATLGEVEIALQTIAETGNQQLILLHCVSNYPADPADVNLRAMGTMRQAFQVPIGYSDHTLGVEVSIAAVALGACVIEKHFTLDRTLLGPDHQASLEPDGLIRLITGIRQVEISLGNGRKAPATSELDTARVARKSLTARHDMVAGSVLRAEDICIKRPGTGLKPEMLCYLVGRTLRVQVSADTVFQLEMFQ